MENDVYVKLLVLSKLVRVGEPVGRGQNRETVYSSGGEMSSDRVRAGIVRCSCKE